MSPIQSERDNDVEENDDHSRKRRGEEYDDLRVRSGIVQRESLVKKRRRAEIKREDYEMGKRIKAGKKPFVGEVKDDGKIDSGCVGHEKWKEYMRNYTPRLLAMSEYNIKKQQNDLIMLRELMFSKFEFPNNEVTNVSFQQMVCQWMRQTRSRWKQTFATRINAPQNVRETDWEALRARWLELESRTTSEKMAEVRSKVINKTKVGR